MPCSTSTNTLGLPIPDDVGTLLYTMTLSGFNGRIPSGSAITLTTFIIHSYCGDLVLTLTSPKGTSVILVYRIGNQRQNIYNGTVWSDPAEYDVGNYLNNLPIPVTQAKPQTGAFADFDGENPNGVWTFTVADVDLQNIGFLNGLSLNIPNISEFFTLIFF